MRFSNAYDHACDPIHPLPQTNGQHHDRRRTLNRVSMTTAEILKPRLRGVLHTWAVPVAAVIGATLLMLASGARERIGTGVWAMTLTGLFAVSATYHRGTWRPAVRAWLQRVDHSMIFVFIAGGYTPIALLLLEGSKSWIVLTVVWGGALAGVVARLTWHAAPAGCSSLCTSPWAGWP